MIKKPVLKLVTLALLSGSALSLSACADEFFDTTSFGIFPEEQSNMTQQNYAAADFLIQQAKSYFDKHAMIKALPLSDINQPDMESQFGKIVPEQIGIRLSQLGYRVDLSDVATAEDTNYLRPHGTQTKAPDYILSGTFNRRRLEVDVSMRMIDPQNGRVIAVFDYILPRSREMDQMARPKPKIMRMPPSN